MTAVTEAVAALSVLAWLAYLASRLVRHRGVPELVAFLAVGALLGPSALNVVDQPTLERMELVTQLALSALMFIIGERISVRALRSDRWVVTAGLLQFALTVTVVYLAVVWAGAEHRTALLLAVLAGAGAPMTVAAIVSEKGAKTRFAGGLVGVHAVADTLAVLGFAAVLPIAGSTGAADALTDFLQLGAGGALLGVVLGWVVARLADQVETSGELLLFTLVHILLASTVALALGLSLPLAALVMGATAASLSGSETSQRVFVATRSIEQPLYLLFFGLAGASIHLDELPSLGLVGITYVVARAAMKLAGGFLGGLAGRFPPDKAARLATGLVPQAGVAVGLAVLATEELGDRGAEVAAVVLGSVVLFELVGPFLVARGLQGDATTEEAAEETAEERLPGTVLVASEGQLRVPQWLIDWAARMGAELVVLAPGDGEDQVSTATRESAGRALVPYRHVRLGAESFPSAVARVAGEQGADLVVLPAPAQRRRSSRLVLLPHERIARRLSCPVVLVPAPDAVSLAPAS